MSSHQIKSYLFLIVLSVLSIWLFRESASFATSLGAMDSTYGPEFFPQVLLGLMLFLCVCIGIELRRDKKEAAEKIDPFGMKRVFMIVVLCGIFAFAWENIGFLISAYIFSAFCCLALKTSWKGVIAIAVFIPSAYFFFTKLLMVSL